GEGFELRTSGWGAIRGGKGLFITADDQPKASGQQLDMAPAQRLLEQALQQSQALAETARAAQALAADCERQQALLNDSLKQLRAAGLLASAPAGIALVSGADLQTSAANHLIATAGGNADISAVKRFTVAAGDAVSLFAQKLGMKLFAAGGKVEIQAQGDELQLAALKDVTISSTDGKLVLSAAKEVWIGSGGSYIRITQCGIENATPGDIFEKCAVWVKRPPASMQIHAEMANILPAHPLTLNTGASPASRTRLPVGMPYKLFAEGVLFRQGVIDETGDIPIDHQMATKQYELQLASGAVHAIPTTEEYRGNAENGELAARGFQFFESAPGTPEAPDRAVHRQVYDQLLGSTPEDQV
ncbi:Uncharacterized conserved protein, DUF2345 family, partial [Cupriavidus sp. OV038]|uniref:type VI secretion system Vgr family protein n=2 Tax=unclassified Cupriavidus TaxID=2640874 RepID=UPI0008E13D5B